MNKLLVGGLVIGGLALVAKAATKVKDLATNFKFYIISIDLPKISGGFLNVPLNLAFVNNSDSALKIDKLVCHLYIQSSGDEWSEIGSSTPKPGFTSLARDTTKHKLVAGFALLQAGLSVLSIITSGKAKLKIESIAYVGGKEMKDYQEFTMLGGSAAKPISGFSNKPSMM